MPKYSEISQARPWHGSWITGPQPESFLCVSIVSIVCPFFWPGTSWYTVLCRRRVLLTRSRMTRSLAYLPVKRNVSSWIHLTPSGPKKNIYIYIFSNIFWSPRRRQPHRSVGSGVPAKPSFNMALSWDFVGLLLGVCWAHVGFMLGQVWPIISWAHVGILSLWACAAACRANVEPCWAHVGPMLALCWAVLSSRLATLPIFFADLGPFQNVEKDWAPQAKA